MIKEIITNSGKVLLLVNTKEKPNPRIINHPIGGKWLFYDNPLVYGGQTGIPITKRDWTATQDYANDSEVNNLLISNGFDLTNTVIFSQ